MGRAKSSRRQGLAPFFLRFRVVCEGLGFLRAKKGPWLFYVEGFGGLGVSVRGRLGFRGLHGAFRIQFIGLIGLRVYKACVAIAAATRIAGGSGKQTTSSCDTGVKRTSVNMVAVAVVVVVVVGIAYLSSTQQTQSYSCRSSNSRSSSKRWPVQEKHHQRQPKPKASNSLSQNPKPLNSNTNQMIRQ